MLQFLTQSVWVERIGWVLVHSLWQFVLVAAAAAVLQGALARRSASTRYRVLLTALFIAVMLPAASWFLLPSTDPPSQSIKPSPPSLVARIEEHQEIQASAESPAPPRNRKDAMPMARMSLATAPMADGPASLPSESVANRSAEPLATQPSPITPVSPWSVVKERIQPWLPEIVLVWFGGVLLAAFRPLLSWRTVRRLRTAGVSPVGSPVHEVLRRLVQRLGLAKAVEVLQSSLVKTPVVIGCIRPLVLLPLSVVAELPPAQLELILAHELAHIRRRDYLVNLIQTVVETIFFYHPAVWWLSHEIRNERENCCDDVAMATVGSRADYGRALLAIAELRAAATALSVAAGGGSLLARIQRIAGCEPPPRLAGGGSILLVILASLAIFSAGTWGAAPPPTNPQQVPPASVSSEPVPSAPKAKESVMEQSFAEGIATDAAGKPLEGAEISCAMAYFKASAQSGPDGHFRIGVPKELPITPPLLARSKDLSLIGYSEPSLGSMAMSKSSEKAPLKIVLKPARTIHVKVITSEGKPAVGVSVEALAEVCSFPGPTTDQEGRSTIQIPPDAQIQWIVALKDGLGFEYYENYRSWPSLRPDPPPETIALTLHKPHPIQVRTTDMGDRPVSGVFIAPWTLQIPGKLSYVNFSGSTLAGKLSDASGICDFAWLPAEVSQKIGFEQLKEGYCCPDQPAWDPEKPQQPVTFRLLKNGEVSGTVRFPDGKPAAGITILGEGRGATNMYFRGMAKTGADGTYRLSIYPRQSTIIGLADRDWAAASHTGVQLEEGNTRGHLDFTLARGTKIRGRLTVGADQKPEHNDTVTLIELGEALGADARKFGHDRGNLVRWAMPDANGEYEFRVGPGEFKLWLPNTNPNSGEKSFKVTDQPELVYNGMAPRPAQIRVTGRVVNAADGKPVAGATVHGEPIGPSGYARFEARAGGEGEFSMDRMSDTAEYGFYARAPEKGLAGFTIVPSSKKEVTVEVHPAATVVGYVYGIDGKPIVGQKVTAIIGCSQQGCTSINVNAVSGKNGQYRIPGLAVDSRCSICFEHDGRFDNNIEVKLDRPGEIAAQDAVLARKAVPPPKVERLEGVKTVTPVTSSGERATPPVDLTFTGTIRDEATKKPLSGATVVVRREILNPSPGKYRQIVEETRHTTDSQGHFTFTIRKEHASVQLNEVNRRMYIEIDAMHPGYVDKIGDGYSLNMILKNIELGERPFFEDFRLSPGKEITAVVAAPDGAPLAGVFIQAYLHVPDSFGGFHETQTDKQGRFRMTIPAPGGAALWIVPQDYAPLEVIVDEEAAVNSGTVGSTSGGGTTEDPILTTQRGDLGVFKLKKGLTLTGTVFSQDGKPIAGQWVHVAQVRDRTRQNKILNSVGTAIDRFAKTDARGQVTFDPLPPGKYTVEPCENDRYRQGRDTERIPIQGVFYAVRTTLRAGVAQQPFVLRAVPTVKIVAQYYSSDGKKTSGHGVTCYGKHGGDDDYWQAEGIPQDGRVELLAPRGLEDARLMLITNEHSSLRFQKSAKAPLQAGRDLKLGTLAGDLTGIRIIRYVAPILLVKPIDTTGKPLASAQVAGHYQDVDDLLREGVGFDKQTDGRYRSMSLLPDQNVTISVTAPGYQPQSRTVSQPEGTTSELPITLEPR
jgi:beta-lactamase regulating signal transducer with metallopeptidase domain